MFSLTSLGFTVSYLFIENAYTHNSDAEDTFLIFSSAFPGRKITRFYKKCKKNFKKIRIFISDISEKDPESLKTLVIKEAP